MSLLTPSDSHNFQYFPSSSMDYSEPNTSQHHSMAAEWAMYAREMPDTLANSPNDANTDALSKATKDLMSLDANRWHSGSSTHHSQQQHHQSQQQHYHYYSHHEQHQPSYEALPNHRPLNIRQQPRRNVTFPFLTKKDMPDVPSLPESHPALQPINTSYGSPSEHTSTPYSSLPTPATSSSSGSSYSYITTPVLPPPMSPPQSVRLSRSPKRMFDSGPMPVNKRTRTSPPYASQPTSRPSSSSSTATGYHSSPALTSSKPALLSPSQKKANHIQSEQKRRANIRRGYEALCETVPTLREAIRQDEVTQTLGKDGKPARSKRGKGKAKTDDATGDKIDGRAGPRSENVVLVKTIDYINDLVSERTALAARLERARSSLPPGHPALHKTPQPALWEREWKGGENQDEDEEEESD